MIVWTVCDWGVSAGVTWAKDRDRLLPGYREEWEATRPDGGHVVGVTGA